MPIYKSKNSTDRISKYLIPKLGNDDNEDWAEIIINNEENYFIAKRLKTKNIGDEWEVFNDTTFPSSLLMDFLRYEN